MLRNAVVEAVCTPGEHHPGVPCEACTVEVCGAQPAGWI